MVTLWLVVDESYGAINATNATNGRWILGGYYLYPQPVYLPHCPRNGLIDLIQCGMVANQELHGVSLPVGSNES